MAESGESYRNGVSAQPRVRARTRTGPSWLVPAMVVADALSINVGFYLAHYLRYEMEWPAPVEDVFYAPYRFYFPVGLILSVFLLTIFWAQHLYSNQRGETWLDEVTRIVGGTATGIVAAVVIYFFYRPDVYSRLVFIYAAVLIVVMMSINRAIKHLLLDYWREHGIGAARVLIVGAGEVARSVIRSIVAHPELGYRIIGMVDDDPENGSADLGRIRALGGLDKLPDILSSENVDEVIVTLPWTHHDRILQALNECQRYSVQARIVPDLFQISLSRVDVQDLDGIPLFSLRETKISGASRAFKRTTDLICGFLGFIVFCIIYIPIALAIKIDSPGPVIYSQERVGKHGRRFNIHKFRSMRVDADQQQQSLLGQNEADGPLFKMRVDPRCTRVGRILRRLSLDEVPQVLNVLKGEMSLIGPRPNRPKEVEQYKPWQRRRMDVSPGMTGLWQVSGRSDVAFDEMVLLDIYYIENWSPMLDLKIALRTIPRIFFGGGAY